MSKKSGIDPKASNITKNVPKESRNPQQNKWVFSYAYWKQIENFGLDCDKVKTQWFVSLLDKFRELSNKGIEEIKASDDTWRCHSINWQDHRTKIRKEDFTWIPSHYLESEEIEFYQFQLSKAMGRVIGFFDYENIFQIVLLDPMHNAQLSKYSDYKIRQCRILEDSYEELLEKLNKIKQKVEKDCVQDHCSVATLVTNGIDSYSLGKFIFVEDILYDDIQQKMHEHKYESIFDLLVDSLALLSKQE